MAKEKLRNFCNSCNQRTWHDLVGDHKYNSSSEDYHFMVVHAIVECRGCGTVSFRHEFHDYEIPYVNDDGEWEIPVDIENFPKKEIEGIDVSYLPDIVGSIYKETCDAYRDGAYTLAGIGFRATIEAICNDQKIKGKELSTRINNLATKGLISKKDSNRLHAIRFLGNDAAHDVKKPLSNTLKAALVIIEHLLMTVYILDEKSKGKLEEIIIEYDAFEKLLTKKIKYFKKGDEFPLSKFLGKDIRRLSGSFKAIEKKLHEKIGKGEFTRFSFGEKKKYLDSKEELQHYVVN